MSDKVKPEEMSVEELREQLRKDMNHKSLWFGSSTMLFDKFIDLVAAAARRENQQRENNYEPDEAEVETWIDGLIEGLEELLPDGDVRKAISYFKCALNSTYYQALIDFHELEDEK